MPSSPLCHFLLQLQPPSTKKRCVCPARLLLLQRQTVPRQHLRRATTHISDTTELPRCQIWARFCAGAGKPSPTSPWATQCYLLPQSVQHSRLIFLKFTLESRPLCLQSLQWLPKTCIMKLKPLASLYNSHSESGRGSFLELTLSSWEHLRASHVTASPLA